MGDACSIDDGSGHAYIILGVTDKNRRIIMKRISEKQSVKA
jgi:hypothetical protein